MYTERHRTSCLGLSVVQPDHPSDQRTKRRVELYVTVFCIIHIQLFLYLLFSTSSCTTLGSFV